MPRASQSADQELSVTWYGDASLVFRFGETEIGFDPFEGLPLGAIWKPPADLPHQEVLRRVEAVFVTHGHFDHIYHIPRLYGGRGVPIYCTAAPAKTLANRGVPESQLRRIEPGWTGQVGPFQIQAYPSRHCRFDRRLIVRTVFRREFFRHPWHLAGLLGLNLAYPEAGEILFYEVACNGFRVQVMGSMNLEPEAAYPMEADLLVLPLQGRSDQDVYALGLVERLKPRAVVLDHYDDAFPPMSAQIDVGGFVENVENRFSIPCQPLKPGAPIKFR